MNRLQSIELNKTQKRKYIEKYFRKFLRIKGVQNAIVFNSLGIPKHSSFEKSETIRSIGLFDELIFKVKRAIQLINAEDQFVSIRLRTHKFEILISKDLDDIYFVIFQNAKGDTQLNLDRISLCYSISFLQIHTANCSNDKLYGKATKELQPTTTQTYVEITFHAQLNENKRN